MSTRRGAEDANRESHETALSRDLREMKDRLRRMETRFVQLAEHMGFDTERKLPTTTWPQCEVLIPSTETSISDILKAIPVDKRSNTYRIKHKGQTMALINWIEP